MAFGEIETRLHNQVFFQQYRVQGKFNNYGHCVQLSTSVLSFYHVITFVGGEPKKVYIAVSNRLDNFTFTVTSTSNNIFPGKLDNRILAITGKLVIYNFKF